MRNRKINKMNKEKVVMIASSLLLVTACTLTGVYINGKEKARTKENVVDFTELEDKAETNSVKNESSINTETAKATEYPINNSFVDQDLDVDPIYQETGSSSIINPGISENSVNENQQEETEEKEGKAAKTTDEEEKTPDGKEKQEAAETMSDTVSSC